MKHFVQIHCVLRYEPLSIVFVIRNDCTPSSGVMFYSSFEAGKLH